VLIIAMAPATQAAKLVTAGWLARGWRVTAWICRSVLVGLIAGLATSGMGKERHAAMPNCDKSAANGSPQGQAPASNVIHDGMGFLERKTVLLSSTAVCARSN
jgi:hypothetical protein